MNGNKVNINKAKSTKIDVDQSVHFHNPRDIIRKLIKEERFEEAKETYVDAMQEFMNSHPKYPNMQYKILNSQNKEYIIQEPITQEGKEKYKLKGTIKIPKKTGIENAEDFFTHLSITGEKVEIEGFNEYYGENLLENPFGKANKERKYIIEAYDKVEPFPVKISAVYKNSQEVTLIDYTKIKWEQFKNEEGYSVGSNRLDSTCPFLITYFVSLDNTLDPKFNFKIRDTFENKVQARLSFHRFNLLQLSPGSSLRIKLLEDRKDIYFDTKQFDKSQTSNKLLAEKLINLYSTLEKIETYYKLTFSLPLQSEFKSKILDNIDILYNATIPQFKKIEDDIVEVTYNYEDKQKALKEIETIEHYGNSPYQVRYHLYDDYTISLFNEQVIFKEFICIGKKVYLEDINNEKEKIHALEKGDSRTIVINFEGLAVLYKDPSIH